MLYIIDKEENKEETNMVEVVVFEKRGISFRVTAEGEKLYLEAKGHIAQASAVNHPQHGWLYHVKHASKLVAALGGKGNEMLLPHESAELAKQTMEEAIAGQKKAIETGETKIKVRYHDGEYLSGYEVFGYAAELLINLGVAKEISGWGVLVDEKLIATAGEEFGYPEAVAFAQPRVDAKKAETEKKETERAAKFAEARETGKPVTLSKWTDDCDDPKEECSMDIVTEYAMPDGKVKQIRRHTW